MRRRAKIFIVTTQQGVPGDAVPWPEREVSSLPSLFPRLPPQAAQERYLSSYYLSRKRQIGLKRKRRVTNEPQDCIYAKSMEAKKDTAG